MVTKLRLSLRTPILGLAFRGLIFGAFLYFYYLNPSVWRGGLFLAAAFWFYGQSLFNFTVFLPTLLVTLFLALWIGLQANFLSFLSLALIVFIFVIVLGVKSLIITHRTSWCYLITCALSYLLLINFFLLDKSSLFPIKWLIATVLLTLLFWNLIKSRVALLVLVLLVGEIMWLVNWLPIGPLSATNLTFLSLLLALEAIYYQRLSWKNLGLFAILIVTILSGSYWRL